MGSKYLEFPLAYVLCYFNSFSTRLVFRNNRVLGAFLNNNEQKENFVISECRQ